MLSLVDTCHCVGTVYLYRYWAINCFLLSGNMIEVTGITSVLSRPVPVRRLIAQNLADSFIMLQWPSYLYRHNSNMSKFRTLGSVEIASLPLHWSTFQVGITKCAKLQSLGDLPWHNINAHFHQCQSTDSNGGIRRKQTVRWYLLYSLKNAKWAKGDITSN